MTSLLQPAYSLVLGSKQWTTQVVSLALTLEAAPLLDVLSVCLPALAPLDVQPGDPVTLALNNGEQQHDVFSGVADRVERTLSEFRVIALDAGGSLARYRPAVTYEQVTAATLVRNLCGDVGVEVSSLADGVELAFYVADPSRTALEHVGRVCAWSGALARVGADNKLETLVINATQPEIALRYGRDIVSIDQDALAAPVAAFVVAGESGAGATSAPEALRPTTDFFAGSRPDGPSASHIWSWQPALRTAQGAATAGAALDRAYRSSRQRTRVDMFLQPALRPGTVLEIQDLPRGLSGGPVWVTGVRHRLWSGGASTRATIYMGGDAFDPSALLGSLAGLGGGLV